MGVEVETADRALDDTAVSTTAVSQGTPLFNKKNAMYLQNVLMRLHLRKHRFLYTGLLERDDVLVMGNYREDKFSFGDPEQTVGVLHLKDDSLKESVHLLLSKFGFKLTQQPMQIIHLTTLLSALEGVKWDADMLPATVHKDGSTTVFYRDQDVLVAEPVEEFYTYATLVSRVSSFLVTVPNDTAGSLVIPFTKDDEPDESVRTITILHEQVKGTPLEKRIPTTAKFIITKGIEWLSVKAFLKEKESEKDRKEPFDYTYGLRLWAPEDTGREFRLGGYFTCDEFTLLSARMNVFVVPFVAYDNLIRSNTK